MPLSRLCVTFLPAIVLIVGSCTTPPVWNGGPPPQPAKSIVSVKDFVTSMGTGPTWLPDSSICPIEIMKSGAIADNYFDNNCSENPEGCLSACEKGDGERCYALAVQIDQAFVDRGPHPIGMGLHLRACSLGYASGCTNAAASRMIATGDLQDRDFCSFDTFEKTCSMEDSWGCTMYGQLIIEKAGRPRDLIDARKALEKACRYGDDDEACRNAKQLLEHISTTEKNTVKQGQSK